MSPTFQFRTVLVDAIFQMDARSVLGILLLHPRHAAPEGDFILLLHICILQLSRQPRVTETSKQEKILFRSPL